MLQHTVAKYVLELAQLEYDLAHLTPSLLAASSLYLALLLLNTGNSDHLALLLLKTGNTSY